MRSRLAGVVALGVAVIAAMPSLGIALVQLPPRLKPHW